MSDPKYQQNKSEKPTNQIKCQKAANHTMSQNVNIALRVCMSITLELPSFPLSFPLPFNGSPIVSPTTDALCASLPFPKTTVSPLSSVHTTPKSSFLTRFPCSMYFFALSHAPPVLLALIAPHTPLTNAPINTPAKHLHPNKNPITNGVLITNTPGGIISFKLALVEISIHAA